MPSFLSDILLPFLNSNDLNSHVHWQNHKKHCILLKTTFEVPFFLIKEALEQAAAFNYDKFSYFLHDQQMRPSKKVIYPAAPFVASSHVLFLNLLLSKYVLKISTTFLAFFKAG